MLNLLIAAALIFNFNQEDHVKELLKAKLNATTECWRTGDMECFMQTYWKSDSLTFIVEGGISYGWDATLQKYKVAFPTAKDRGTLSFKFLPIDNDWVIVADHSSK